MSETINTGTDDLLAALDNGVLTLTLNRPEARNAMSGAMTAALAAQLADAELNAAVKVIVLTGRVRDFVLAGMLKAWLLAVTVRWATTPSMALYIVSASTNGVPQASFTVCPSRRLRLCPGQQRVRALPSLSLRHAHHVSYRNHDHSFCPRRFFRRLWRHLLYVPAHWCGKSAAIVLFVERVDAQQALDLGLTNWVCEADELATKTKEIADQLAAGPTVAYRYMKENFARALSSGDVDDCLDLEATHHVHCGQTEDHRNATKAFVEKREPVFQGR